MIFSLKRQLHKLPHLIIQVFFQEHPEVVIVLRILAGYLRYFLEAQVIFIRLFERKYHMYKILSQLCDPGNALLPVAHADHGPGRYQLYRADLPVLLCKMPE